jgi:hypothetical protein
MERNDSPSDGSDSDEESGVSRRRLIATGAAAWTTVSVAGCHYITDPGPPDGSGGGAGGDGDDGGDGSGDGGTDGEDGTTTTPVPTGSATVTNNTTTTADPSPPTETPTATSTGTACESRREFPAGIDIGLNVGVYDSDSGDFLGDDALDGVTVEFPNEDYGPLELNWSGEHEQYIPDGWGGKIETDEDIEPGTYRYEITIEGDGPFEDGETITDQFTIVE